MCVESYRSTITSGHLKIENCIAYHFLKFMKFNVNTFENLPLKRDDEIDLQIDFDEKLPICHYKY